MSNWTAAALLAGVAATSGYFLHATPVTAATTVITGQPQAGSATVSGGSHKPTLVHPVATSSGSGVTAGAPSNGAVGRAGSGVVGGNGVSTVSTWKDH
jgi:hypothetical protein